MKYPFLTNNELVLVDYLPGSSGQLLLRLWSELDSTLNYANDKILTDVTINAHKSSKEIDYDILMPKRLTNWFIDKCEPDNINDYAQYFEFLGTSLVAMSQRWNWADNTSQKFYDDHTYQIKNRRVLFGIHSWHKHIPFKELQAAGYNIKCISVVAHTDKGKDYQYKRCRACYPQTEQFWKNIIPLFNNKNKEGIEYFDFCTLLSNKDSISIIEWISSQLGSDFNQTKVSWAMRILDTYYDEIVDNL